MCSRTWPRAQSQQHCEPPAGRPADPQQHSSSQSINCPIHCKAILASQGTATQHATHKAQRPCMFATPLFTHNLFRFAMTHCKAETGWSLFVQLTHSIYEVCHIESKRKLSHIHPAPELRKARNFRAIAIRHFEDPKLTLRRLTTEV